MAHKAQAEDALWESTHGQTNWVSEFPESVVEPVAPQPSVNEAAAFGTEASLKFAEPTPELLPAVLSDNPSEQVVRQSGLPGEVDADLPEPELTPEGLLQLVIARNAEVRVGRLQVEVANRTFDSEAALYETLLFGTARREDRKRQRTVEERQINIQAASVSVLDENISFVEAGIRNRLSTGGETSLSYRQVQRSNNIIASNTGGRLDTEMNGTMVLNLRQPLLRGRGSKVVETGKDVADLDFQISRWQLRQVLQRAAGDALVTYWQLYRSQETLGVRQEALDNSRRIYSETESRVKAGRSPEASLLEARSAVVTREADFRRAEMALLESKSRLLSFIGFQGLRLKNVTAKPASAYTPASAPPENELAALEQAMGKWPMYQIALLRSQQGQRRLDFAKNQTDPQIDLQLNYAPSGLSLTRRDAFDLVTQNQFPELLVGVTFEMPIEGNLRASAQYEAQLNRFEQSNLEASVALANLAAELTLRRTQLSVLQQEILLLEEDVIQRKAILDAERVRYDKGFSLLAQLLARVNDLADSRLRLLDAILRHEQSRIALINADGSLFESYGVVLKD